MKNYAVFLTCNIYSIFLMGIYKGKYSKKVKLRSMWIYLMMKMILILMIGSML